MDQSGGLSQRKESTGCLDSGDVTPSEGRILACHVYPFALVLRLRVLQVVCGISSLVMGTVALIEERGELNLGLGMPAGVVTVAAAAASIHTSRGFSGYHQPSCGPPLSSLRFLGPSPAVALPLTLLWLTACTLHIVLLLLSSHALLLRPELAVLACVLLTLDLITLIAVAVLLRIDCTYDPD